MFEPFEGVPSYPALEREVLEFWDEREIFRKLRDQTAGGPRWSFQDGPITANNRMGVHHAWGRTYKDIFDRFHAMNGRRLRWQNGFDCQGLWVEVEVEKQLGFATKTDILDFGMDNFSRACRARVEEFAGVIAAQSKRLGMWMDWERSYFTYDDSNIEGIWGFLARCHELGWLAPDYRVMPWCPRCETSLSQHESADAYKDVTHRSVYKGLDLVDTLDDTKRQKNHGDTYQSKFKYPQGAAQVHRRSKPSSTRKWRRFAVGIGCVTARVRGAARTARWQHRSRAGRGTVGRFAPGGSRAREERPLARGARERTFAFPTLAIRRAGRRWRRGWSTARFSGAR